MTTGEKIKAARLAAGLTQKQLGELTDIAEPTIRRYESGRLNPKIGTLSRIGQALSVSAFDLADEALTKELQEHQDAIVRSILDNMKEQGMVVVRSDEAFVMVGGPNGLRRAVSVGGPLNEEQIQEVRRYVAYIIERDKGKNTP